MSHRSRARVVASVAFIFGILGGSTAAAAPSAQEEPAASIERGSEIGDAPEGLSSADWRGIRAAYDERRHAAVAVEEGYRARNPGQRWTTAFDGRGFETTPDHGEWSWGLDLVRYGWGENGTRVTAPRAVTAEGGRVSYEWDDRLTEWFVNDRRGLEHGYTVRTRPRGKAGRLQLDLAVRGGLEAEVSEDGRDVRFLRKDGQVVLAYSGLIVVDAGAREFEAAFERTDAGLRLRVADEGARYPLIIDRIAEQPYLKASNTDAGDQFGWSVSVSGDTVVVGARSEDSNATGVNGNQADCRDAMGSGAL